MSPRLLSVCCLLAAGAGFQCAGLLSKGAPKPSEESLAQRAKGAMPQAASGEAFSAPASVGPSKRRRFQSLQELAAVSETMAPADVKLHLLEALNQLSPEELAELLSKEAESSNFFRTLGTDFQYAARRLSEIAPEKAAALWLKRRGGLLGGETLLVPWAKQHPEAFVSWSLGLSEDVQRAAARVLAELARENPEQFAAIASQLAKSPAGVAGARSAIKALSQKEGGHADSAEALAYAKALPEGALRSAALLEAAQAYGLKRVSLEANPELRDALAALSPAEARSVAPKFADSAEKLPQGAVRECAFSEQIKTAAQKDPRSAAKKVEALSGSADYPAAVRGFVEATAAKDPVAAVEWALSIGLQGGQRTAALEKAAAEYFRQKPDEARKWVANAPLSGEEYFLLTGFRR